MNLLIRDDQRSPAQRLSTLSPLEIKRAFEHLTKSQAHALYTCWEFWARPAQLEPEGDWSSWLIMAGRGWGKTRTGAEWVLKQVRKGVSRIALVGATASDVRDVMIGGESGILAVAAPHERPTYYPSKRRLVFPNGCFASTYTAEKPERLRGPQHEAAWCDELGAWRYPDAWDQLMFGLRLGNNPRVCVTTTPRPVKLIRDLVKAKTTIVTKGSTYDNEKNLSPKFFRDILEKYEGTRLGRQEIEAELLEDIPGALWTLDMLDQTRLASCPDSLERIVVAVDPPVTSGEDADECGIVVCGVKGKEGYVLADLSAQGLSPKDWALVAVKAYHTFRADRIVAEVNNGGELVESVIRQIDVGASYRAVRASRGKAVRAEPVAALYEQMRVHHVGAFNKLEKQMCEMTIDFDKKKMGYSPDRVDALVWGLTDLMLSSPSVPTIRRL